MNEKYTHNILGSVFKDGELFALTQGEAQAITLCIELNALYEENEKLKEENQKLMKALGESSRMAVETLLPTDEDSLTINGKWW